MPQPRPRRKPSITDNAYFPSGKLAPTPQNSISQLMNWSSLGRAPTFSQISTRMETALSQNGLSRNGMNSLLQNQKGQDFPDYEELDLMMASALKRCYDKQTHFRKKLSVEEQRAQNRFLRGRQIAYLICEYFRPAGSYGEVQGLSGLFSMKLGCDSEREKRSKVVYLQNQTQRYLFCGKLDKRD